jgi:uncharacterized coiled-coil protein SlyX
METPMEARIARLEADVTHVRTDIADIKVDVRALRDKMDSVGQRFDAKLDAMTQRSDAKFDANAQRIDALKDSISSAKTWALLLYFALAGSLFGAMARGFGWI